jgi:hypothetical protein
VSSCRRSCRLAAPAHANLHVTIPYTPQPPGTTNVCIAIVAHTKRSEQAHALFDTVGAAYMSMDNGTLGCEANHRKAWTYLAGKDTTWSVVLEDDAEPVEDFTAQLERALSVAPTPVVGLYLGTATPAHWQPRIQAALQYHPEAHWFTPRFSLINAVGVAIRTHLLPLTLEANLPADQALANWCRTNHHQVAYTNPSLIDHRDEPTVIAQRVGHGGSTQPRKAWNVGTRTRWTPREAPL